MTVKVLAVNLDSRNIDFECTTSMRKARGQGKTAKDNAKKRDDKKAPRRDPNFKAKKGDKVEPKGRGQLGDRKSKGKGKVNSKAQAMVEPTKRPDSSAEGAPAKKKPRHKKKVRARKPKPKAE